LSAPPVGPKAVLKEVLKTKSGIAAFTLLIFIISLSLVVPIYAPYNIVKSWNNPEMWLSNPRCAAPVWIELFIGKKLPKNMVIESEEFHESCFIVTYGNFTIKKVYLDGDFNYKYDGFPSEFKIEIKANTKTNMRVDLKLIRPDGDEIFIIEEVLTANKSRIVLGSEGEIIHNAAENYVAEVLGSKPKVVVPQAVFFAVKDEGMNNPKTAKVLKGRYTLKIEATSLNPEDTVEVSMHIYGRVYGLIGTDAMRRDLLVGILWGAPIALAFGLTAAIISTFAQAILGVISGYLGGKVDEIIQRATEFMMVIPMLPIMILISFVYRLNIWTLLAVVIIFSIFGSTVKVVRSMVPQIKEEHYILAAISYGASRWRIMFRHIFPRVLPYTFSILALSVPGYIFLEAALSFLGLGDPVLPTWGKILGDAQNSGAAYHGYWWWILAPAMCIAITAIAFALLGYAFDKVVNPRLREM